MLCTATDVGIYGLLASQSCYHSMLAPCWFTLWTSSRFLYPYILLISLEIFLISFKNQMTMFFAIILVNSCIGLPRCGIFTVILSRKQAASILAKKVELLLRKMDLSGDWVVLQNPVSYVCR